MEDLGIKCSCLPVVFKILQTTNKNHAAAALMSHQPRVDRFCFTCRYAWAANSDASVDSVRTNDVQCYMKKPLENHTNLLYSHLQKKTIYFDYMNDHDTYGNVTWYRKIFATWRKGYVCHYRGSSYSFCNDSNNLYRSKDVVKSRPLQVRHSYSLNTMTGQWLFMFCYVFHIPPVVA